MSKNLISTPRFFDLSQRVLIRLQCFWVFWKRTDHTLQDFLESEKNVKKNAITFCESKKVQRFSRFVFNIFFPKSIFFFFLQKKSKFEKLPTLKIQWKRFFFLTSRYIMFFVLFLSWAFFKFWFLFCQKKPENFQLFWKLELKNQNPRRLRGGTSTCPPT